MVYTGRAALPKDGNASTVQLTPATVALARTVSSSISSSTTLNLNASTTVLRCYSADKDTYLKWGSTAVTSSNFDEIIPAGQVVDLYVPTQSDGTLYATIRVIERAATATIVIIEK
jgi:hypothetical protein